MQTIFISYRRDDSAGEAGRLHDDLVHENNSVFMDVTALGVGRDFREVIDTKVATCGVLLAVIGKDWLEIKNEVGQRRLDEEGDFVRHEIASALKQDIPVVPVLVRGARMPLSDQLPSDIKELAYLPDIELIHTQWASGLRLLIEALRPFVEEPKNTPVSLDAGGVEPTPILPHTKNLLDAHSKQMGSGTSTTRNCLAGDIGGTHTRIALFEETAGKLTMVLERVYPSRDYKSLDEILSLFMSEQHAHIHLACFGVAGPVSRGQVSTPNLPWVVQALKLARQIGVAEVWLINDLQAHTYGVDVLAQEDFVALNELDRQTGNAALIAAGTGLGEAGLYWDGSRRWPFPCEGGHADFAPRNDVEIALLQYLIKKFGRVSYERIVSGPGIKNTYEFLRDTGAAQEPKWLKEELAASPDPVAIISQYGMQAKADICQQALDIFVCVYGAEAGNLALKLMATGGVFISGGIAAKILPKLTGPAFMKAFVSKGRLQPLMETISVKVIVNDKVGLIGAARYAVLQQSAVSTQHSANATIKS